MAAPQALTDAEGWRADVAQRNRVIHDLSHRVVAIQQLHAKEDQGVGICPICCVRWPCPTYQLANGERT